jgi:putative N6-adenine-specific DNA methylase
MLTVAGYDGNEPLVDPLCGTGTFSLEAAMMANHIPAGWYREFAFMGWPCFRPSRWKYIRSTAKNAIVCRKLPMVCASDKDERNCRVLEKAVCDNDLIGTICVFKKDFFDLRPRHIKERTKMKKAGLVVLNPPYGRRLETKTNSEKMFVHLCKKLKRDFKGWKMALVAPNKKLVKSVPFPVSTHDFVHGGLNLTLLTGRIR